MEQGLLAVVVQVPEEASGGEEVVAAGWEVIAPAPDPVGIAFAPVVEPQPRIR